MNNTFKYVRNELTDDYGILKLQNKILEIMVYLDQFCKEHDITYFLMGGSALGAIRHGGFIPWDDDLDIFMPYNDYERFASLCEIFLDKERFYFQRENSDEFPYFFSKLRMNGTTFIDETQINNANMHQGIFVDIMCLNHAAPKGIKRIIQFYEAALLRSCALSKVPRYHADSVKKRMAIALSGLIVRGKVKDALINGVRKYNRKPTEDVAHIFGRASYKNAYYPANLFMAMRYVPFEQVSLAVPNGVEEYLSLRYGRDYMHMPDEKTKAIYKTHSIIWDIEKDYSEYIQ